MQIPIPDRLKSERLVIRPYRESDYDRYISSITDEEASRYLNLTPEQRTEEGARALFDLVIRSYASPEPICALVIALREDNAFIGSCGLSPLDVEGTAECFYTLLRPYWGRGYASEAAGRLLRWAFEDLGLSEVAAYMDPQNTPSRRVAERVGMQDQGVQPYMDAGQQSLRYAIRAQAFAAQDRNS